MARVLQGTNEVLLYAGDEATFSLEPKDGKGTSIDISGTVIGLTCKAYEYLDDTTEAFSIASVVVNSTNIDIAPTNAETLSETPQSYMYIVKGTVDGNEITLVKDQITILRA